MVLPTYQCREAVFTAAVKASVNGISACAPVDSDVAVTLSACAGENTIWLAWINQIKVAFCYIFGQITSILSSLTTIDATLVTLQNEINAIPSMRIPGAVTVTPGAGAGAGATATIVGNDTAGQITLNTGTGQALGVLFTLVFATPYTTAGVLVVYGAGNGLAQPLNRTPTTLTTVSGSTVSAIGSFTTQDSDTFVWNYYVIGGT